MINNFMILVRRLMLLYSAMYMQEHAWFQVVLFAFLSLLYLAYLTFTWPFKNMQENLMLIFNVYFTLTISYLVMVINGMVVTSYQFEQVGLEITFLMYFNWAVNVAVVLGINLVQMKHWCKKLYKKRFKRKNKKTKSSSSESENEKDERRVDDVWESK